jgi:hypothetical protein
MSANCLFCNSAFGQASWFDKYDVKMTGWAQLPPDMPWGGETSWVAADGKGQVIVMMRVAPIIRFFTREGQYVKGWGEQSLFKEAHSVYFDAEGNIWGVDSMDHVVYKFDPNGKILMTLGKAGVSGSGPDAFDQPTDVVVAPSGDIFVTDSHRNGKNNRVVKFSKDGKFIKEWGTKGSGPGQISEPHTIAMDSRGRLFVGDRENNRIQIFDQDGKYITEWRQFSRPSGIYITKDDTMYVADSESGPDTGAHELTGIRKGIRIGSAKDGTVTAFIEDMESTRADHSGAEGLGVDSQGNVYGAVVRRQMLERHVRK